MKRFELSLCLLALPLAAQQYNLASSEKFVGDGERQRAVSRRNLRNFRHVESNDLC